MKLHNRISREELIERMKNSERDRTTISFYKYYHLGNPQLFRDHLYLFFSELEVFGRIYVAEEGINAQISVPTDRLEEFKEAIGKEITFFQGMRLNIAVEDNGQSFYKLVIKVRDKILADGLNDKTFNPANRGNHLSASEVNELANKDTTLFVDMRNHYEWEVGHFKDAILPEVETFRESLPIIEDMLEEDKDKDIIMYCTGGIRCEKASAYYKHKGFKNVHMIDGGIIKYAHDCEKEGLENLFIGKNFVFDERLGERISDDIISQCHQCGKPCDTHVNCENDACHLLFIQCDECKEKYDGCCSIKCADFIKLDMEEQREKRKTEQFNGTRFGKGRYKAYQSPMGDLVNSNIITCNE